MASTNAPEAESVYGAKHAVVSNAERVVVYVCALERIQHSRVMNVRCTKGFELRSLLCRGEQVVVVCDPKP